MIRIFIFVFLNSVIYTVCYRPGYSNIGENLEKEPEPNLIETVVRVVKKLATGDIYQGRGVQKHDLKYYNTLDESDDIEDPVEDYDYDYGGMRSPRYYASKKGGDEKEESALKAMKRSSIEGLKQFGQGVIGVDAGFEDSEEKAHQSFEGKKEKPQNFNSFSADNSHRNRYGGRTPNRRVRYPLIEEPDYFGSDYFEYSDDEYDYWRPLKPNRHRMRVNNYESGIKNVAQSAYKGVKVWGKGVLGIKDKNVSNNDDYDYGKPDDIGADSSPESPKKPAKKPSKKPPKKSASTAKLQKNSFNEENSYVSKEKNGKKHETLDKHEHYEKITGAGAAADEGVSND